MSTKRVLLVILVASTVLLAVGVGPQVSLTAPAALPAQEPTAQGITIPYPGHLADEAGQPVAEGAYDFTFALYRDETGGEPLWSEVQERVPVQAGQFLVSLGTVSPIPAATLAGDAHWLAVGVRGPGETDFTPLTPRQRLSAAAPSAPSSPAANGACPHDHFGELWVGDGDGLGVQATGIALAGTSTKGIIGATFGMIGVHGIGDDVGVVGGSESGIGVVASGSGSTRTQPALLVSNGNSSHGMAAYLTNQSDYHNSHFENTGSGGVLFLQNGGDEHGTGGGDFIAAVSADDDLQFRVATDGSVSNDTGIYTQPADFAEMLPAREGLEPGDVLVIGDDGKLAQCTAAYQATVAGVYSTQPGFVAGMPLDGAVPGTIPLAIAGVVPTKVSAENGAIHPGDLLVASATAGHAMKAGPNPPQGTVLGKALEKWDAGTGIIKMLATLQ